MPDTEVACSLDTCCSKTAGSYRSSNAGSVPSRSQASPGLWSAASLGLAAIGRLSKDYEYSVQSSETLIEIAATLLMLNRLAQA